MSTMLSLEHLAIYLARRKSVSGPSLFDEDLHPRDNHGEFAKKENRGGGLFGDDDEPGGLFGGGGSSGAAKPKEEPEDEYKIDSHYAMRAAPKGGKVQKIQERPTDAWNVEGLKPIKGQKDLFGGDDDDAGDDPHDKLRRAHQRIAAKHPGIVLVRSGDRYHTFGDHAAKLKAMGLSDSGAAHSFDQRDLKDIIRALVYAGNRVSVAEPSASARLSRRQRLSRVPKMLRILLAQRGLFIPQNTRRAQLARMLETAVLARKPAVGQGSLSFDEALHPRDESGKFSETGGAHSEASHEVAKPKNVGRLRNAVEFETPIKGPSGAELHSYDWKYYIESDVDDEGEEVGRRVSDWEESQTNEHTGREVVHHFRVKKPGEDVFHTVSLETAMGMLGYTADQKSPGVTAIRSIASAVKSRALSQMKLQEQEEVYKLLQDGDSTAATASRAQQVFGFKPSAERGNNWWDSGIKREVDKTRKRIKDLDTKIDDATKDAVAGETNPAARHRAKSAELEAFISRVKDGWQDVRGQVQKIIKALPKADQEQADKEAGEMLREIYRATHRNALGETTSKTPRPELTPATERFGRKVQEVPATTDRAISKWYLEHKDQIETAIEKVRAWSAKYFPERTALSSRRLSREFVESDHPRGDGGRFQVRSDKDAVAVARALRKSLERHCGTSSGMCVTAAMAGSKAVEEAETWSGSYRGEPHTVLKVGGYFIDVTADQFGRHPVRVMKRLPGAYQQFTKSHVGGTISSAEEAAQVHNTARQTGHYLQQYRKRSNLSLAIARTALSDGGGWKTSKDDTGIGSNATGRGWRTIGGGAHVYVSGGQIIKGCPGLKGEMVETIINEGKRSRQRRAVKQERAEAYGIGEDISTDQAMQLHKLPANPAEHVTKQKRGVHEMTDREFFLKYVRDNAKAEIKRFQGQVETSKESLAFWSNPENAELRSPEEIQRYIENSSSELASHQKNLDAWKGLEAESLKEMKKRPDFDLESYYPDMNRHLKDLMARANEKQAELFGKIWKEGGNVPDAKLLKATGYQYEKLTPEEQKRFDAHRFEKREHADRLSEDSSALRKLAEREMRSANKSISQGMANIGKLQSGIDREAARLKHASEWTARASKAFVEARAKMPDGPAKDKALRRATQVYEAAQSRIIKSRDSQSKLGVEMARAFGIRGGSQVNVEGAEKLDEQGRKELAKATAFLSAVSDRPINFNIELLPEGNTRAHARRGGITIRPNEPAWVIVHEVGHVLEFENSSQLARLSAGFVLSRTQTNPMKSMSRDSTFYNTHEVAPQDHGFLESYTAKWYGGNASEVLSMGVQHLFQDPAGFAQHDPKHLAYTLGVLSGKLNGRSPEASPTA